MEKELRIRPAGDQALLLEFGAEISPEINRRVHEFARKASAHKISGIGEMISSYCSVLVYFDPLLLSFSETASWVKEFLSPESSGGRLTLKNQGSPGSVWRRFRARYFFRCESQSDYRRGSDPVAYGGNVSGIRGRVLPGICRYGKRTPENSGPPSGKSQDESPCRGSRDWGPANRNLCRRVSGGLAVDRTNTLNLI